MTNPYLQEWFFGSITLSKKDTGPSNYEIWGKIDE
jgi:hypothetical protein